MQVQAVVLMITPSEYWVFVSSIMLTVWVIFGFMVCSPVGGLLVGAVAAGFVCCGFGAKLKK
jgi:hypothetical protein